MHRLHKPPQLHQHPWDKYFLNRIVPTNLPPIINKGKLEKTGPATKVITNSREAVNNRTLPIMPRLTCQRKTPQGRMNQDTILHCEQTNLVHSVMFMGITHLSVPSWLTLRRPFKMRPNRTPMLPMKPNPTRH